jgi:hypothetical protein
MPLAAAPRSSEWKGTVAEKEWAAALLEYLRGPFALE